MIETREQHLRREQQALGWAAAAAVAVIAWLVRPVAIGILVGALLAFSAEPLFEKLKPRLGVGWAALAVVMGSTLALAGALGALGWLLVARGTTLTRSLIAILGTGGSASGVFTAVGRLTERVGITPAELSAHARSLAESGAAHAASAAQSLATTTASSVLALFFTMLSMHFILRHWPTIAARATETFPLRPEYTTRLLAEFHRVGRSTLLGTVVTGIAQGLLATIGFFIAGVPEAFFFGALTAVASLIPAIGTLVVWVPVGVVLILTGHPAQGIVELIWGAVVVVGVSDYLIRPRLVGGEAPMPSLLTFAALFGGVEVFGLKGLIVGPLLMALATAVLRLYGNEARRRRHLDPGRARLEAEPCPPSL